MDTEDTVLAGLERIVAQSNSEPVTTARDESGKFRSTQPAQEPAAAEASTDAPTAEKTEAPQTDGTDTATTDESVETIEIDPDEELFEQELDVDGRKERKKLSLREYQQGYLRQADYTRKTQELAKQRAEVQDVARQAEVKAAKEYAQKLDVLQGTLVKVAAPELASVDWNKLANEDPSEYVRLSNRATQLNQIISAIETEKTTAQKRADEEDNKKHAETWQKSLETLQREIPDWGTPLVEKLVTTGKNVYGVDVAQWRDAGQIKMLHDAMKYRETLARQPDVAKKIALAPKVLKPGAKQAFRPSQSVFETVRKTGKAADALPFFEQLLSKG